MTFISIEAHPLTLDDLSRAHAASPVPELAAALQRAWPPVTPNLHLLDFDDGRVRLMLALGDVQAWLPELVASVDAIYLDGFAPAHNPQMWDQRVCKALGRLAAPGATVATWSAASALRAHLTTAGFDVKVGQGTGGKRDITLGRYAPAHVPRRAPARTIASTLAGSVPHAVIVGGGLAGCATAWALAEQGWRCTVIERQPQIASEASGNPAGMFHGIVHAQDGVHARFNRAAAMMAADAARIAIERHGVVGAVDGLLRLDDDEPHAPRTEALHWVEEYVQQLDPVQASALAGIALQRPAWFYPHGGWVDPAGLARAWLQRAGTLVEQRCGVAA
ncbi:MAG: FAD-dependent oxidoreductase, partial [Rhizobacter sp.]